MSLHIVRSSGKVPKLGDRYPISRIDLACPSILECVDHGKPNQPWDISRGSWAGGAHLAFADAVMVSLSRLLDAAAVLANKRDEVIESTKRLFEKHPAGTFTGRANTKKDVEDRIRFYDEMIEEHLRS